MVIDMFKYTISKEANEDDFRKACEKIEKSIENLEKEELLEDVDGSQIQIYLKEDKKIKVVNDYEVDAVYADSDIDLKDVL